MDTGILSRVLDDIREYGGDYAIDRFDVGHETDDPSHALITVTTEDDEALAAAADAAADPRRQPGRPGRGRASPWPTATACSPTASTRPPTSRPGSGSRAPGSTVGNPEMDCGLIVERDADGTPVRVYTLPMSDVRAGHAGRLRRLRHQGDRRRRPDTSAEAFGFMESEVSSEKPQAVLVRQVADGMREAKAAGKKVLWVGGPGVVHTGAAPGDGRAGRGRLRRRAVRRQRARHPRHRVGALRHRPRRRPGHGPRRRARPRAPHPRDQHDPQGGLDPRTPSTAAC